MLIWPGRRFIGRGHPQGVVAAPVGSNYIDESNGAVYTKVAGQGPTGWYLVPGPTNPRRYRYVSLNNAGTAAIPVGTPTSPTWNPTFNSQCFGSIVQPNGRHYAGGYTLNAVNDVGGWFGNTVALFGPYLFKGQDYAGPECDVDAVWEILTTPKPTAASVTTDLTALRFWIGIIGSGGTIVTNATLGHSDTLATALAPGLGTGAGRWASAFRYSTGAADPGWVGVNTNDNGAAFTQSVSGLVAAIAINTQYRLRLRYLPSRSVPAVAFSVNDGPEVFLTGNVGPGSGFTANSRNYQPFCFIDCQDAANRKSLSLHQHFCTWGDAV